VNSDSVIRNPERFSITLIPVSARVDSTLMLRQLRFISTPSMWCVNAARRSAVVPHVHTFVK